MLVDYLQELWKVLLDLSPSLLVGLMLAGVMHEFLPRGLIRRHLNESSMKSVFNAVLIGVPMPLCSCGVVPTAIGLKNEGASKGATTAFLISTPQTGVDSILVSAAFLGWPFAIFKVAAAFVTGLIGGGLANGFTGAEPSSQYQPDESEDRQETIKGTKRVVAVGRYALFDLFATIDLWILAGILIAAAIATAIPSDLLDQVELAQGLGGMLLVLAISLPLYVCTTGSVPIAASLIAIGMPPGTALVFLMAGPATNMATIGAVYRALGWRVLTVYLAVVVIMSIVFGWGFDFVLGTTQVVVPHHDHEASWISIVSAVIVCVLLVYLSSKRIRRRLRIDSASKAAQQETDLTLHVEGMSCQHCVANIKHTLERFDEVEDADPELASGVVRIKGTNLDADALGSAVEKSGYRVMGKTE
jgi:uncharacterized membrane protein YraQ (UPF0718 family)/copper chaperone CopZ